MTLIQTHHGNVIRLGHSLPSPDLFQRFGELIAQAGGSVLAFARRRMESLVRWRAQRRHRSGLSMFERARQRRELERLSDRELRDIGISRYEIDFLLRRGL
jgi:uncharacterized protein YjiS (DUF1127 family)